MQAVTIYDYHLNLIQVTTQLLVDTQGGKKLRALTKHQDLDIKATAAEILNVWKGTVSAEAQAIEKTKQQLGKPSSCSQSLSNAHITTSQTI